MCASEYVVHIDWRVLVNRVWRANAQVLFWFFQGHSDSGMGKTSALHRGDFLGLKTSMRWLMFYSIQSSSVCNSPILSSNIIYIRILMVWLSILFYVHSTSTYVTYWVLCSCLCLHCKWFCRYLSWERDAYFRTRASVYEHFVVVIFWLRVSYSFWVYILGVNVWEAHWVWVMHTYTPYYM